MNGYDLERFVDYLGLDSDSVWAILELIADAILFDTRPPRALHPQFQAVCLDLLEEDAYLDLYGCLDAPL